MMATTLPPRAVIVTRPTEVEALLAEHGTLGQARFVLAGRGLDPSPLEARHARIEAALQRVLSAIPLSWRRARVDRAGLDRFLFEPEDLVIALGQDGLVANVAKYLTGQPVLGLNPLPDIWEGVLVRHPVEAAPDAFADFAARRLRTEPRTMAEARLDDGQRLLALNEVFLGHRSHQSARYRLAHGDRSERQSSSGVIVTTGTGATGWARSIVRGREGAPPLPGPGEPSLAFFVREAWASRVTAASLTDGRVGPEAPLTLTSEMEAGGTLFGDGLEDDHLVLPFGRSAAVRPADVRLELV
jgi:hypothetical protein